MARIRTIKPEFWKHEDMSELPEATHLLAAALLNYADDFGYFNANPALVKAECSPLREPSVSIPESLRSLQTIGYIDLGSCPKGRRYGRIAHFAEHQRVSHPTKSKIECLSITWDDSGISPEILQSPPETFAPEQGTGNREQGTGNNAREGALGFDEFWHAYPKRVGRGAAEKSWKKLKAEDRRAAIDDVSTRADSDQQWAKSGGQFIPNPATYLNQKRWTDDWQSARASPFSDTTQHNIRVLEPWVNGS